MHNIIDQQKCVVSSLFEERNGFYVQFSVALRHLFLPQHSNTAMSAKLANGLKTSPRNPWHFDNLDFLTIWLTVFVVAVFDCETQGSRPHKNSCKAVDIFPTGGYVSSKF